MIRRDFLRLLTAAGLSPLAASCISGLPEGARGDSFGNLTLMHFTDCHAQLLPVYFREPAVNLGMGRHRGRPPHLVGSAFLDFFGIKPDTAEAYAFTPLNFTEAARLYGKMGGFAHLASLIKGIRHSRGPENCLLLDGGDSWQGSATALWTRGRDMLGAANLLGVDVMTGHWEFTYGSRQVLQNIAEFDGDFVAQNVALTEEAMFTLDADEGGRAFPPYVVKDLKNARVAVIGQAFPYTPIAHPRRFVPDWRFGIGEEYLRQCVGEIRRKKKAEVVVLLSHNGMDVDLKLASRVSGIDVILGGHTHDAVPRPVWVDNSDGKTLVTNAGSHGKFLALLDIDVAKGRVKDFRYRLTPVFANLIEPDAEMQAYIEKVRAPFSDRLNKPLAVTERLLYRRDNFQGSFDRLILDALREVGGSQIALSPGFRWGPALLPGREITVEDVMSQTAITYPETYVREMKGRELKSVLEDVCDNLFNPDPYFRQGGDMVRVGGMNYACDPGAPMGRRISAMRLDSGEPIEAEKNYKVAGWAGMDANPEGRPVWQVVFEYLADKRTVEIETGAGPVLLNVKNNPGLELL
ncbi:MAG: thiosulfohydrolase SoxB [Gammaproteobacteria bacterium]